MDDYARAMLALIANQRTPFVQRILRPQDHPVLDIGGGQRATHKMAWGEAGGRYYAFPTVAPDDRGDLRDYGPDEGWRRAIASGDYIPFDKPEDADWFSRNYKAAWGGRRRKQSATGEWDIED